MIPIAAFIAFAIIIGLYFWFKYRVRNDVQATIRLVIDKGVELSPELIDRLGHPKPPRNRDLRHALIWLGIASGCALFGLGMGQFEEEAYWALLSISAFPFCIGAAYLIMWRFASNDR